MCVIFDYKFIMEWTGLPSALRRKSACFLLVILAVAYHLAAAQSNWDEDEDTGKC